MPREVARNTERPKLVRSGVWGVLREVRSVGSVGFYRLGLFGDGFRACLGVWGVLREVRSVGRG